jgi:hypothetical protein
MTGGVQQAGAIQPISRFSPPPETPKDAAQAILRETRSSFDRIGMIEARLDTLAKTDPQFAAAVRVEIMASPQLTTVQKGELARNERGTTVDLGNGRTDRFTPDGIDQDVAINRMRADNSPKFQQYVRLAAGVATNEAIKAVMANLLATGQTPDQAETAMLNKQSADMAALALDLAKIGLDIAGIFDQSGISDAASAGISLYQGEYWDAFMSGLALVPVVGAAAVLGKLGKWGEVVTKAIKLAAESPLTRKLLEPALKGISDTLNAIPAAAYKAMPESARTALEGIKSQLDNLLGRTSKKADEVAAPAARQLDQFDEIAANVNIDTGHILNGEVKVGRNGTPRSVGFHLREGGQDLPGARVSSITQPPNATGVYKGRVEVQNPADGSWVAKNAESTFYPDKMTASDVEAAIRHAYADALRRGEVVGDRFTGDSGLGFKIQGFVKDGVMATAYPLY